VPGGKLEGGSPLVINDDIIRRDTVRLITQLNAQIEEVTIQARKMECAPHQVRDANGGWALIPLLQAKATAYNTIVLLSQKR